MQRKLQMYLPNVPCHVVLRGNNRNPCFFRDEDYSVYLKFLKDALEKYSVSLHSYVLMPDHVHLFMTPDDDHGASHTIESVCKFYEQYVLKAYRLSGRIWEELHKASLVQAESYALACYCYIEMNPVRTEFVKHPGDYRWSSYRSNAYGEVNPLITGHEIYNQLGNDLGLRRSVYRDLFNLNYGKDVISDIRSATYCSMPLGDDRFRVEIEHALGRKISYTFPNALNMA